MQWYKHLCTLGWNRCGIVSCWPRETMPWLARDCVLSGSGIRRHTLWSQSERPGQFILLKGEAAIFSPVRAPPLTLFKVHCGKVYFFQPENICPPPPPVTLAMSSPPWLYLSQILHIVILRVLHNSKLNSVHNWPCRLYYFRDDLFLMVMSGQTVTNKWHKWVTS